MAPAATPTTTPRAGAARAREELGLQGLDERRIDQLAEKMRGSRAQLPSLVYRLLTPEVPGRVVLVSFAGATTTNQHHVSRHPRRRP